METIDYHTQINPTMMECLQEMGDFDHIDGEFDESSFSITAELD